MAVKSVEQVNTTRRIILVVVSVLLISGLTANLPLVTACLQGIGSTEVNSTLPAASLPTANAKLVKGATGR